MEDIDPSTAQPIAQAAIAFQQQRTGHQPKEGSVASKLQIYSPKNGETLWVSYQCERTVCGGSLSSFLHRLLARYHIASQHGAAVVAGA